MLESHPYRRPLGSPRTVVARAFSGNPDSIGLPITRICFEGLSEGEHPLLLRFALTKERRVELHLHASHHQGVILNTVPAPPAPPAVVVP